MNVRRCSTLICLFFSSLTQIFPAPRFDENMLRAGVDYQLWNMVSLGLTPGMSASVVRDNQMIYYKYAGYSGPNVRYGLASVTKTVTATAIMQLVERGLIELDKPASYYLDGYHIERIELGSSPVLIRHLLSHTSGLPDTRYFQTEWVPPSETGLEFKIPLQIYPAGRHYRYSNFNFMILGTILERVTGRDLSEYLKTEIFIPAGMDQAESAVTANGAGGLRFTLSDISAYAMLYLNKGVSKKVIRLLSEDSVAIMLKPITNIPPPGPKKYQGLGFRVESNDKGVFTFFHIGGDNGIAAWVQMFPNENTAICYLGNPPEYKDALMGELLRLQARLGYLAGYGKDDFVPRVTSHHPTMEEAKKYFGKYKNPVTQSIIEVYEQNQRIYAKTSHEGTVLLKEETTNVYLGANNNLSYEFALSRKSGNVLGLSTYYGYFRKLDRFGAYVDVDDE